MTAFNDRGALAKELHDAVVQVTGVTRVVAPAGTGYFAGGRPAGVLLSGDVVEVHVAVDRYPVEPIAEKVREVVSTRLSHDEDDRPVRVNVAALDLDNLPMPKRK